MMRLKSLLRGCRRQMQKLLRRDHVQPVRESQPELRKWWQTPMGTVLLEHEQRLLTEELSCLFGYHFLQLSMDPDKRLFEGSRISHCFAIGAGEGSQPEVQALSELESLPLAENSVDLILLHHVLEFSQNPQQVLKEAARVAIPNGHIIIFGFNPWSPMGFVRPLARLFGLGGIWRRHSLRRGRLEDWLQFLDFNVVSHYQGCFNLPVNQRTYLKRTQRLNSWQTASRWACGNYYCLIARKDVCGMTPLKPDWEQELMPAAVALPKQSIARAGKVARTGEWEAVRTGYSSSRSTKSIIYLKKKR